jgi:hypothetical protein
MRPCQVFDTLEVLRKSFSGSLRREGIELTLNDTRTVLEAYQQWLSLAYDLEYLHPDTLQRDAHRLFTDMVKVDVLFLLSAMAECYHLLQMGTYNGFKAHCSDISPHLYAILRKDFEKLSEGDLYSHKRLIQLFSYLGRLSLREIDLSQQCVRDYLASEEAIPQSYPEPLVLSLNRIVRRWFGPFVPYEIVPGHGPGSVAGIVKPTLYDKYKNLKSDLRLRYSFGDEWWCSRSELSSLDRTSQTIFVPKSYKTFRTISMEPSTLQYFQQGVWRVIDKYVRSYPYLKSRIDFHDEERNRHLAQEGSLRGNYATIDLSAASDSVGYELVKKVFRGTWLSRFLVSTRSTKTLLPDGTTVGLRKFAPMGSALCFPIETIIFASICEHVTRGLGVAGDFSVYGDDIIVPTSCVERLIRVLSNLGFRVNLKKSFTSASCHYRESCGGEYVDGFDVSPMRISRTYNSTDYCDHFTALISLANAAYEKNFYALRHFFLKKMRDHGIKPLFAPTSILGRSYSNFHLSRRVNKALQREEVRASAIKAKRLTSLVPEDDLFHEYEEIRYRHWLESTYSRPRLEWAFQSYVGEMTEYVSYQWFVAPCEVNEKASRDDDQVFNILS